MIRSGLVSITFRQLSPEEIVELAAQAGVEGIEWGGDIHVPHGDLERARRVREMTDRAGLTVAAYGSYYDVGHDEPVPFGKVLDTAVELAAPVVRVWAGRGGSAEADEGYRRHVAAESQRIADLAAAAGLDVAYEFHGGTLSDTHDSARRLLEAVDRPNVRSYWQPPQGAAPESCLEGIAAMRVWVGNLHVFNWARTGGERLALADGAADWRRYLEAAAAAGGQRFAMLEFVRNDAPRQFLQDAATLKGLLHSLNSS